MSLDAIIRPKSIAIVGASADDRKYTGKIQHALARHGFSGDLYPINPKYPELLGRQCYPTLADAPDAELVIAAVPSRDTIGVLEVAAAKGARGAFVVSAGFAEAGPAGRRLQDEMRDLASRTGMRILGPNCQGAYRVGSGVCTSFATPFLIGAPLLEPGPLAWLSQSGALGGAAVSQFRQQGLGIGYYVSTGNEADVQIADVLDYVAGDPDIEVICGYLEDVKDGQAFARAMARANAAGTPVILIKGGSTAAGAEASRLHTGALSHGPGVVEQFLRQTGVVLVDSLEQLAAAATSHLSGPPPGEGRRTVIIGNSGGLNTILADTCNRHGLEIVAAEGQFLDQIAANVPSYIVPGNPIDLAQSAGLEPAVVGRLVTVASTHAERVIVCLYSVYEELGYDFESLFGGLRSAIADSGARAAVLLYGCDPKATIFARSLGLPVYDSMEALVGAASHDRRAVADREGAGWLPAPAAPAQTAVRDVLHEATVKTMLAEAGVPVPRGVRVRLDAGDAVERVLTDSAELRFPVVAKLASDQVVHKAASGAMTLDIQNEDQLRTEVARLAAMVPGLGAQADGGAEILVEEQATVDIEVMLGLRRVPGLGIVVVLGTGGTGVEERADVGIAFAPLTPARLDAVFAGTGLAGIVNDDRTRTALAAVVGTIQQFFVERHDLVELDVNPIGLDVAKARAIVLDAVAVRAG